MMILYCNPVNNVKHFPSLFSIMAGFFSPRENNNNSIVGDFHPLLQGGIYFESCFR